MKFRTKFNLEEKKELMDKNGRTEISQLLQDYVNAYNNNPQIVPNYQVKWNSILQEETIGECLPQLAAGKMTLAQMVETADESIREYEKEMMGGEGCWCHFINNKFFTFRKVYFFC